MALDSTFYILTALSLLPFIIHGFVGHGIPQRDDDEEEEDVEI